MKQQGFTLIELIIALTIFSIISVMAYQSLHHFLSSEQYLSEKSKQWQQLLQGVLVLERDIEQAIPREFRINQNETRQTLTSNQDEVILDITVLRSRSIFNEETLPIRVQYHLDKQTLQRWVWIPADQANPEPNQKSILLKNMTKFDITHIEKEATTEKRKDKQQDWPKALNVAYSTITKVPH